MWCGDVLRGVEGGCLVLGGRVKGGDVLKYEEQVCEVYEQVVDFWVVMCFGKVIGWIFYVL